MMKRAFMALTLCLAATLAQAVPAKQGLWKTITLADGQQIKAELTGDEFFHYWRTADGNAYTYDNESQRYVSVNLNERAKTANAARQTANLRRSSQAKAAAKTVYTGEKRGLIILVEFPGKKDGSIEAKQFKTPEAHDFYDKVINQENFTDPDKGYIESVYDYFLAQSKGQFKFKFDVVGPYKLGNFYSYYGLDNSSGQDVHLGKMIYDACKKADADVDFSKYDWDGDGVVDQLAILYAGQGQNTNADDPNLIWPQEGSLKALGSDQAPFERDGVTIEKFAISCELGEGGAVDGIGTICHEFSHCFGLPDMYDTGSFGTTELNYGTYVWDLMNMGNYLDGGFKPAGYTAWERMACGWQQPIELSRDTVVNSMKPLSGGGDTYIIYNDNHKDEYFLLENRQQTGFDAGLYASGLLVSHVDYDAEAWKANTVNADKERFSILAADNSKKRTVDDVKGDLYPFNGNNSISDSSMPATTLANKNADGTYNLGKEVTDITQNADGTISFQFRNLRTSGIQSATASGTQGCRKGVYNLNGQRIGNTLSTLPSGIYIVNGKKIIK